MKILLDVGCGNFKHKGYIGMDKAKLAGVDVVHDAEYFPWPFEDDSCAIIIMSQIMEHIKPWFSIDVMNECWRVLENEGYLCIKMPYGINSAYVQDPTHCNPWNENTLQYFNREHEFYGVYRPKPWTIEKAIWDVHSNMDIVMRKLSEE